MNLRALFGRSLKSPEIIEVLERFKLNVVYEFDRSGKNELDPSGRNAGDRYRASAYQEGFELLFDQNQRLVTAFMYVSPENGFDAIDPALMPERAYESFKEAEDMFLGEGYAYCADRDCTWIECKRFDFIMHYEFTRDGGPGRITLTRMN